MSLRRISRYRLQNYLGRPYATEEAEKAALTQWAVHQKEGTIAGQLMEYYRAGEARLSWAGRCYLIVAAAYLLLVLRYGDVLSAGVVAVLTAGVGVGVNMTLSPLIRSLRHPRSERAALWLAWLGDAEAIAPLVRALEYRPRTQAQRAWTVEVENVLADLLDSVNGKFFLKEPHDDLRRLILRAYPKSGAKVRQDFTEGRASLLIAVLRYLSSTSEKTALLPLLSHIIACPADTETLPHRFLVRELACVYAKGCAGQCLAPVALPSVARSEPSLASLRAVLTRRF